MSVRMRSVCGLVVFATIFPLLLRAADVANQAMDNYVIVVFAFDVSRDGHIGNIRVVSYTNPSDERKLKGMLSRKEQEMGVRIISSKKLKIHAEDYGKTRYHPLIFDKRTREYPR